MHRYPRHTHHGGLVSSANVDGAANVELHDPVRGDALALEVLANLELAEDLAVRVLLHELHGVTDAAIGVKMERRGCCEEDRGEGSVSAGARTSIRRGGRATHSHCKHMSKSYGQQVERFEIPCPACRPNSA